MCTPIFIEKILMEKWYSGRARLKAKGERLKGKGRPSADGGLRQKVKGMACGRSRLEAKKLKAQSSKMEG